MQKLFGSLLIVLILLLYGCVTKPDNIKPVENFQANKYMGKWYEIARLDNRFEKGLVNVYAEYSLNPDGSIKVINSGVNSKTHNRSYVEGVAKFVEKKNIAYLKVSFFKPFYGAYIVFHVDDNYKYAYVAGADKDYLWLLSRDKAVLDSVKNNFIKQAKFLGFDTSKLVWD